MVVERRIDLENIDLDRCLVVIQERLSRWADSGLTLRSLTWMDNASPWPQPLISDRSEVVSPMSVGARLDRDDGAEAEVVLYAGGWADFVTWVPGEEYIATYQGIDDPEDFARRLDEAFGVLLRPSA